MNYNQVLDTLEKYLYTLTPEESGTLTVTYTGFSENLFSEWLSVQQALHAIIVLGVPLYWKGNNYQVVSASYQVQKEILQIGNIEVKSYGKKSTSVSLYLKVIK